MTKQKTSIFTVVLIFLMLSAYAQQIDCLVNIKKHKITSNFLNQEREYWVGLPMNYDSTKAYPVIYVLDAEWRFDLIRAIAYDLSGNKKMPHHIIVGIPHIDMEKQRGVDMTFSHSTVEYDGDKVDSAWYNLSNSGGGESFFNYLNTEVIQDVGQHYDTNNANILVGHSYGGYFGGYILPMEHNFTAFQIYDPSMWFGSGEAEKHVLEKLPKNYKAHIFISYQPKPKYHRDKIISFIKTLSGYSKIKVDTKEYTNETHNSLFMDSFICGMHSLYGSKAKK